MISLCKNMYNQQLAIFWGGRVRDYFLARSSKFLESVLIARQRLPAKK